MFDFKSALIGALLLSTGTLAFLYAEERGVLDGWGDILADESTSSLTSEQVVAKFGDAGLSGISSRKNFTFIGGIDGCAFRGMDLASGGSFRVELYKYLEPRQIPASLPYRNGVWGMMIHSPTSGSLNRKLIDVFKGL